MFSLLVTGLSKFTGKLYETFYVERHKVPLTLIILENSNMSEEQT